MTAFGPTLKWLRAITLVALALLVCTGVSATEATSPFPAPFNTDPPEDHPPAPAEMVDLIDVPPGFTVRLFAGEPDVNQPIAMEFDDRGRLWIAENYTYSGGPIETRLRDRILILEDMDGDGSHDRRTVFWEKGFMLTGLTWGFGGVWILNDGTLSFIAERNADDVPDAEPVVMLDGWSKECGHNFVNGLTWGPDGWLYGRHGILDTSYPGVPGAPRESRPAMSCGIWRFHPTRHVFEVVCRGTTNPWGLDYDADNQFFMTNNVTGHLWHVIPGARYERMYGHDANPHSYQLMPMTADHFHWDTKSDWRRSRDRTADDMGGGHSHAGALIYHGENFPADYRGKIFMCNTHGRRINVDRLDRHGSGYVGRHDRDFMTVRSPWFRGVDIKMGPEGAMYVSDWSDNGECHDHDGIHRTSGRIYRIVWGRPIAVRRDPRTGRVASGDAGWLGRRRVRWLQEEAPAAESQRVIPDKLDVRSMGLCEALGLVDADLVRRGLASDDPRVVAYAVRWAGAKPIVDALLPDLKLLAATPQPPEVLLALAAVLQQLEPDTRWEVALAMLNSGENMSVIMAEKQLTLMTWYGIEPVVFHDGVLTLLEPSPFLQEFAVRRIAHDIKIRPQPAASALSLIVDRAAAGDAESLRRAAALLSAFRAGLGGVPRVTAPHDWSRMELVLRATADQEIITTTDAIAIRFGIGAALEDLRKLAADKMADALSREQAIESLAEAKDADSLPVLLTLLRDRDVAPAVIRALARFDAPIIAQELLDRFGGFRKESRSLAIDSLSTRRSWGKRLIAAIEAGDVDIHELTAGQVRQLLALGDDEVRSVLESRWGVLHETPAARREAIERWKNLLTVDRLAAANRDQGATLFRRSCGTCHRLHGEGGQIGPDLTGANRGNLDYLLINVMDPSAVVPKQFTTSIILLADGRVVTGAIVSETEQAVVVQGERDQVVIVRDDIEQITNTGRSLMPDGILDAMSEEDVVDLIGFIMTGAQKNETSPSIGATP